MVEEYDLDKNGKLDAEERQLYLDDRRRRLEDEDAKDSDGNQLYVQVWDADFDNGAGKDKGKMVDTSEKMVNQGLKTVMTEQ